MTRSLQINLCRRHHRLPVSRAPLRGAAWDLSASLRLRVAVLASVAPLAGRCSGIPQGLHRLQVICAAGWARRVVKIDHMMFHACLTCLARAD